MFTILIIAALVIGILAAILSWSSHNDHRNTD